MGVVRWFQMVFFLAVVLEQAWDRKRLQRVRDAQRTWKETARALSKDERREVARAVRSGRAVTDPWLADAAVDMATAVVVGRQRNSPMKRVNLALFGPAL